LLNNLIIRLISAIFLFFLNVDACPDYVNTKIERCVIPVVEYAKVLNQQVYSYFERLIEYDLRKIRQMLVEKASLDRHYSFRNLEVKYFRSYAGKIEIFLTIFYF
jgi:hypothetical protein